MKNKWTDIRKEKREEEIRKIKEKALNNPEDLTEYDYVILSLQPWVPSGKYKKEDS